MKAPAAPVLLQATKRGAIGRRLDSGLGYPLACYVIRGVEDELRLVISVSQKERTKICSRARISHKLGSEAS